MLTNGTKTARLQRGIATKYQDLTKVSGRRDCETALRMPPSWADPAAFHPPAAGVPAAGWGSGDVRRPTRRPGGAGHVIRLLGIGIPKFKNCGREAGTVMKRIPQHDARCPVGDRIQPHDFGPISWI